MTTKRGRPASGNFVFRTKLGDYEVEVAGTRDDVLKTIEDLPSLIGNVHKAFESARPRKVATLTVKTENSREEKSGSEKYPKISAAKGCDEEVLRLLETDWGKWRPRTLEELREALRANGLEHQSRMLATVLLGLVKQEKVRRWNTDAGYVYILAEKEALGLRRETDEQD